MRNYPDLRDCQAFIAVFRHGSFRRAAEEIGLSPSALSRQIVGLEESVGARLFNRDTRNVSPTDQGVAFATMAERMLNVADLEMTDFRDYLAARNGRLVIAGLPSVTAGLLPRLLTRFKAAHPKVDVVVLDALSDSVLHAVENGEADIGFTAATVSPRGRLSFLRLMEDRFIAIGTPDSALSEARPYSWQEIVEMPFIAMAKGTSVRELVDWACQRIGHPLEPQYEVSHLATAGALVSEGLGVTALPELTLPVLGNWNLVQRPISDFGTERRIGLIWRAGQILSPSAGAFLNMVRGNMTDGPAQPHGGQPSRTDAETLNP